MSGKGIVVKQEVARYLRGILHLWKTIMIHIDNCLLSDELFTAHFTCNLQGCKGACCEEGEAGAPLTDEEISHIEAAFPYIEKYLSEQAKTSIEAQGKYEWDTTLHAWVTPSIGKGICVYGRKDEAGTIQCLFQEAFRRGEITWEKPISCHLYPIRVQKTASYDTVNFEPREQLCRAACHLGESHKVKVFQFLKEPLIRKYGKEFFEALLSIDEKYFTK